MKKTIVTLLVIIALITSTNLFSQAPPPPPSHGNTGNVPGGNAPIGGGLFILLSLGVVYGGKKIFDLSGIVNGEGGE